MITISIALLIAAILLGVGIGGLIVYITYSRTELQYEDVNTATNMINTMQNEGIFFRQREPEKLDHGQ